MNLRIEQGSEFQDKDWWKWWVRLEGPERELDQIRYVEYVLHPTFPNPVRRVTDRASNFRLETAGWGVFPIYAKAVCKDGEEVRLETELVLKYPDGTPTTA